MHAVSMYQSPGAESGLRVAFMMVLVPGCEHHAETGMVAHHALVGLVRPFERKYFRHGANTGHGAEAHSVLRVDRAAGRPALDSGAATDQAGRDKRHR